MHVYHIFSLFTFPIIVCFLTYYYYYFIKQTVLELFSTREKGLLETISLSCTRQGYGWCTSLILSYPNPTLWDFTRFVIGVVYLSYLNRAGVLLSLEEEVSNFNIMTNLKMRLSDLCRSDNRGVGALTQKTNFSSTQVCKIRGSTPYIKKRKYISNRLYHYFNLFQEGEQGKLNGFYDHSKTQTLRTSSSNISTCCHTFKLRTKKLHPLLNGDKITHHYRIPRPCFTCPILDKELKM